MKRRLQFIIFFFLIFECIFLGLAYKVFKINKIALVAIIALSICSYGYFFYEVFNYNRSSGPTHSFYWAFGLMVLHIIPKIITVFFWFISLLLVLLPTTFLQPTELTGRKSFLGKMGLIIATIPFSSILYGLWKGKYNFKVLKKSLAFEDLPKSFDGLKVLQISDLHSGSFDSKEKIEYAIDLINQQEFDLLLFTGDIVNVEATEFEPWIKTFNKLKTPEFGKFSVLGNHDYGAYKEWNSEEEKQNNFEAIKNLHGKIDFKLLCNEHVLIEKDDQKIAVVGVENWGEKFMKAGDLSKASEGLVKEDFKILMSHDPSHWEYEVKNHPNHYHLTLSGHTHGFQFGIEIPGFFKWSPVQYVYKQWAGLYEHANKFVYVNRGFGFHAFPGRVGIWPEITVLELTSKKA